MVDYSLLDNVLVISLVGKVDSSTAPECEAIINKAIDEYPNTDVIVDASKLEYISSAGLRVILRLRKAVKNMKIANVSADVYEIFQMTGFSEMMDIEKRMREFSVEGCRVIGEGAKGTVYRYDGDTIVKVYKNPDSISDINRERELAKAAFVLGLPTAISYDVVKVGDLYGSVFELLDAKSFSQLLQENPEKVKDYACETADLLRQIHDCKADNPIFPDAKDIVKKWMKTTSEKIAKEDSDKINKLLSDLPDADNLLHCDYHTNNIMSQNGETLLIDMDTMCHGHPIIELTNIYVTYVGFGETNPENVQKFIGIDYSLAIEFWNYFIRSYLQTDDEKIITDVESKTKLLSYVRMIRHFTRRGTADEIAVVDKYCSEKIHQLLTTINTLEF